MMKLRFPSRYLPNFTNPNRPIPSNTLYIRYNNSLLISNTYLSRRKLWMNYSLPTCKWSINILHLPIHPCRPRRSISPSSLHLNPNSNTHATHIQTTKHNISTTKSMPILSTSSRPHHTNMNWRTTCRTPIHYYWTTSLYRVLPNYSGTNTSH
uniref:Uncharacterized protein n=1 Tax=Sus scrofa TaxID=9823 RepID=A0A8D0XSS0_PIG